MSNFILNPLVDEHPPHSVDTYLSGASLMLCHAYNRVRDDNNTRMELLICEALLSCHLAIERTKGHEG
jgi:hypothetical protein